ncbi:MAG: cytochrome c [Alphaproteobacteria bacterium]|jgi:mono/diheme cytochrome c family protein|nr:cytochrome c [Alphaproteobacteria bacterium]MDP6567189.1 cytochrome c [Alphaproteobacteria bacterium]MDP6815405.1 cytochrome c [Alphaproteobacteria bacterium]
MIRRTLLAVLGPLTAGIATPAALAAEGDAVARGGYLVHAAGCIGCHTDEKAGGSRLAGGRALKTPFGTYFSPNITPHRRTGIGAWSDDDFLRALRLGRRPDGAHYFPVFPYTSYTGMRRDDALAIKAYLFSLKPVERANRPHDVRRPFGWRWTMLFWKWLFFEPGPRLADPAQGDMWNRGGYLVNALGHCGECHTPRNFLGASDRSRYLAGSTEGPDGELVPNITPDMATGIGEWSNGDIVQLLRDGTKPDFDDVQGSMAEAIRDGLGHLNDADLRAIAVYLRSLPAIRHRVERPKKP